MRSQMWLIYNLSFLEVNFQLKCLYRFQEMGDYFQCILVVINHHGSVISKHELAYQNISGLSCRLKLTGIEQVCSQSTQELYFLGGISKGIKLEHRKKNQEKCGGKNAALFYSIPNIKNFQELSS